MNYWEYVTTKRRQEVIAKSAYHLLRKLSRKESNDLLRVLKSATDPPTKDLADLLNHTEWKDER